MIQMALCGWTALIELQSMIAEGITETQIKDQILHLYCTTQ